MSQPQDHTEALQSAVREAASRELALQIRGAGTKAFYGRRSRGEVLNVLPHHGVVNYEPSELVVTARSGTALEMLEGTLNQRGQTLAFEPPLFGSGATLGGAVASGLSGPARPYVGAVRDFVLGVKCINGRGECLAFGGQVMKNVAGYDVSRLMAGALGTLGVLLEVSLKVLPLPMQEHTLALSVNALEAINVMNALAAKPLPITAACHDGELLRLRLAGSENTVIAARKQIGGDAEQDGPRYWSALRNHRLAFFESAEPLWRLSVPSATPPLELPGHWLMDWGGAQRWLYTTVDGEAVRTLAAQVGGHATLFRGGDRDGEVFHPLAPANAALHRNLKRAFDPKGILNPGRLYADL